MKYLMVDGEGDPNTSADYAKAIEALYSASYALKFMSKMHNEFMPANGLIFNGKHHEIHLSDPRKVAPAKLRTVVRQPVRKAK